MSRDENKREEEGQRGCVFFFFLGGRVMDNQHQKCSICSGMMIEEF